MPNYSDDIPDYSKYTDDKLREAERHVDRQKHPDRLALIQKEFELRQPLAAAEASPIHPNYFSQSRIRRLPSLVIYLFYRYYSRRSDKGLSYHGAILVFDLVVVMNLLTILTFAGIRFDLPFDQSDPGSLQTLKTGAYIGFPLYLLTRLVFPKKEILALQYDDELIQAGDFFLVVYLVLSFAALTIAPLVR